MGGDPAFLAFLLAAIGGLGAFTGWLVRAFIADLQKSRDQALLIAEGGTTAIDRLSQEITKLRAEITGLRKKEGST